MAGSSITVPEGHYTVSAVAPQYVTVTTAVQVNAGSTAVATLPLRKPDTPKAPTKAPPAPAFGLDDWTKAGGWSQQTNMITHRGGDYVLLPVDVTQGTARFTVVSVKGRHVEWVAAFRDEKNYFIFQLDDKNLTRWEVRNGSKLTPVKVPHGVDKKQPMSFTVNLTPQSLGVSVLRGGQWVDLDKWDVTGSVVRGRFGFHIPGSDEIGLQDFRLAAN